MSPRPAVRLLVVDDEAALMHALCSTLEASGYDTLGCGSAEEALEILRDRSFDLMLTDMMMPGTDGVGLARAALAHDPQLVVVMMTGQGSIETAVEAMHVGVVDYVLKPFKLHTMLPVLERAADMRRLRLENAALLRQVLARTEALETANRELEAYAATVSHDLRAPLRGIDGLAQLLGQQLAQTANPDDRKLIELIGSRAKRAQCLVEDLLRLSRVAREPLLLAEVDVQRLAEDAVADALASLPQPASVDCQVQSGIPRARADGKLLRQVFANLVGNAIKFSADRPDAHVEVGGYSAEDGAVYFVKDNGAGFDMQQSGKLFMPFERLRGAERFEGSGVGLSIVRRIVDRHGGHVWVHAEPERGASFFFTLGPIGG